MKRTSRIEFDTTPYERAHGKTPRGFGHWAFCQRAKYDHNDYLDHVIWAVGTYRDAKKAVAAHFAAKGIVDVVVCS